MICMLLGELRRFLTKVVVLVALIVYIRVPRSRIEGMRISSDSNAIIERVEGG